MRSIVKTFDLYLYPLFYHWHTAQCENNHIHIRAEMSALKYPLIRDYTITTEGKLVYKESFEGDTFFRICEMDRI